jgi:glycogen(starch) synthase
VPEKGLHTLLAAVEILARENPSTAPSLEVRGPRSDFHLAYAARLGVAVEAAQAAGADVELGPSLTDSEYRAWLQRQHCIVTPAEWPEPFALVPLEAMAAGRPVVTTTLGGTAELVEDGVNALTFPAGNASALARSLARLRDEPGLAERIADGGFQRVSRRHRREQMAASLDAIVAAVGGRSQR